MSLRPKDLVTFWFLYCRHFMARIRNILREGLEGLLATSEVLLYSCAFGYIINLHSPSHSDSHFPLIRSITRCTIAKKVSGLQLGPRLSMRILTSVQKLWFSGWRLTRPSPRSITIHAFRVRECGTEETCPFCVNMRAYYLFCLFGKNIRARNRVLFLLVREWVFDHLSEGRLYVRRWT